MKALRALLLALGLLLPTAVPAAHQDGNLICETTTSTGTGSLNLSGTGCESNKYVTFVSQITSGNNVTYTIQASDGKLETGTAVFTDASPDTLTSRTALWSSDGNGVELTLPAGTHKVYLQWNTTSYQGGVNAFDILSLSVDNLNDVTAINNTTESTIEAAIDALANLASIQGVSLGTITAAGVSILDNADPAAHSILGWDNTGNAYVDKTLGTGITTDADSVDLDADLASWAGVTRASGYDTFAATPSMANLGSLLTDEAAGWITFGTTPSSANLKSLVTDETGTGGALVFATDPDISISATTEGNIETAIDTLANLTSIQGVTVTLVDAGGGDVFWGLDDSANAYENLTKAEAQTILGLQTSTTDNQIVRYDSTAGNQQGSPLTIADTTGTISTASGFAIEFDGGTTNTFTCTGGNCTIEGNGIYRVGGTDVAIADGGTGASTASAGFDALAQVTSTAVGRSILDNADPAAHTILGFDNTGNTYVDKTLGTGITTDADSVDLDADLVTWSGVTPGTGVATWIATPSSANLATAVTDETGSGALVFGTAPDLTISSTTETNIESAIDTLANLTTWGTSDNGTGWLDGTALHLDDATTLRLYEGEAGGDSYVEFLPPATLASNRTCQLVDGAAPIPDSCVGDGTDSGGSLADADYGDITVSSSGTVWNIDPVMTVGTGSGITWTFDAGATDPTLVFGSGIITLTAQSNAILTIGAGLGINSDPQSHVFSFGSDTGSVEAHTTATGGDGPHFITYHNSSSPAVDDHIGGIMMYGKDSTAAVTQWGILLAGISDPTNGSEDSYLEGYVQDAGTRIRAMAIHATTDLMSAAYGTTTTINLGVSDAGALEVYSTSGTGNGPTLLLSQDSSTPNNGDAVGEISFLGNDSGSTPTTWAAIEGGPTNVTDGAGEAGEIRLLVRNAGAPIEIASVGPELHLNTGVDIEFAGGTANTFACTGGACSIEGVGLVPNTITLTGGTGIAALGDLSANRTITFDSTELGALTWGTGSTFAWTMNAGATDPVITFASASVAFTGATAYSMDDNLTLDNTAGDNLTLVGTGTGAIGPGITSYHNSSSPAAADDVFTHNMDGEDSGGGTDTYVNAVGEIAVVTAGGEYGRYSINLALNGSLGLAMKLGDTAILRLHEPSSGGANYKGFTTIAFTADTTCTFENDANFIPDSCVGDGSDASDIRLKKNLRAADPVRVSHVIDGIKIYDFQWNRNAEEINEYIRLDRPGFGPMAQEIYEVDPLLARPGGPDVMKDPWKVLPENIVPFLVVEAQSLRKRVAELEKPRRAHASMISPTCYGLKLGSTCIGVSMQ